MIDVDSIYTTMMEIGQWVSSDNYSGRIVKISNAFVFKGPVYNYSRDFPFVWDEFNLPVRYGSDMDLAKEIVVRIASEELSDYVARSISEWKGVVAKYYIEDAEVEPTLAMVSAALPWQLSHDLPASPSTVPHCSSPMSTHRNDGFWMSSVCISRVSEMA